MAKSMNVRDTLAKLPARYRAQVRTKLEAMGSWPAERLPTVLARPRVKNAQRVEDPENPGKMIDSKHEARRLAELRQRFRLGEFQVLATQVWVAIEGGRYVADFVYGDIELVNGQPYLKMTVEDAKGFRTEVYRAKRRQMLVRHGIRILES